jgi:hypothetical protein
MPDTEPVEVTNLDGYGFPALEWSRARDARVVASRYREGGWPATVEEDGFTAPYRAPAAGPPPWHLYRLSPHTVFGTATVEPYGATRWRFAR